MKKHRNKVIAVILSLTLVFTMMPLMGAMAFAGVQGKTVIVDFGSKHSDMAKAFADNSGYYTYISGGKVSTIIENGGSYADDPGSSTQMYALQLISSDISSSIGDQIISQIDNKEKVYFLYGYLCCGLNPLSSYADETALEAMFDKASETNLGNNETIYVLWEQQLDSAKVNVEQPKCGTKVEIVEKEIDYEQLYPLGLGNNKGNKGGGGDKETVSVSSPEPKVTGSGNVEAIKHPVFGVSGFWVKDYEKDFEKDSLFTGTMKGGNEYMAAFMLKSKFGYYFDAKITKEKVLVNNKAAVMIKLNENEIEAGPQMNKGRPALVRDNGFEELFYNTMDVVGNVAVEHDWDEGKVTKEPTTTEEGEKTYTCKGCSETKVEKIAKKKAKKKAKKGFYPLKLTSKKQTGKSITISWSKAKGAKKYAVYGFKCGKENMPKYLTTIKGNKLTVKKILDEELKKGTYYKFIVRAKDADGDDMNISMTAHVITKGSKKYTNYKKVSLKVNVNAKGKKLKEYKKVKKTQIKVGDTFKIKAKGKKAKGETRTVRTHRGMRFESSDPKVAKVSNSGKVTAKKAGSCTICAYVQNGVYKTIKVTVKAAK